jgi:putative flippase GtrA
MSIRALRLAPFIQKALRFAITGVSGLFVDFSITLLLRDFFFVNGYLANFAGFATAATSNFYINKKWTFNNTDANVLKQLISFIAISLVGLFANMCFLFLFHHTLNIHFYISKSLAIMIVFAWNFAANNFLTFRK